VSLILRPFNLANERDKDGVHLLVDTLVELCKGPGVSVAGTALAHGINANLLRRWVVKYSKPRASLIGAYLS
jgi:hypothetical protein